MGQITRVFASLYRLFSGNRSLLRLLLDARIEERLDLLQSLLSLLQRNIELGLGFRLLFFLLLLFLFLLLLDYLGDRSSNFLHFFSHL